MSKAWIYFLVVILWAGMGIQNVFPQSSTLRLNKIQFSVEGGQKIVSFGFSQPPDSVKAFTLLSPSRLVVDVKGAIKGPPSATYTVEDALLWRVRAGSHPQHIRFVLDLKGKAVPQFVVEQQDALVTAALKVPGGDAGEARPQVLFTLPTKAVASRREPKTPAPAPPTTAMPKVDIMGRDVPKTPAPAPPTTAPKQEAKQELAAKPLPPQVRRPPERKEVIPKPDGAPALRLDELTLSVGDSQQTVLLRFSQPPDSVRTLALSSPSRLVVDVTGPVKGQRPATYRAEDPLLQSLLARVRVGSHSQRMRFVLDLKTDKVPPFTVEQKNTLVTARLGKQTGKSGEVRSQVLFSRPGKLVASRGIPRIVTPTPPSIAPDISLREDLAPETLSQEARLHLRQGQLLYDRGDIDKAIVQWQETVRMAPDSAKAHHLLGLALRDRGDTTKAIAEFQQALRLDPDNATAHVHLAMAYESKGDTRGALTAYHSALQLVPASPYVHNRLGHLLAARGDWQGAIKEWQQTTQMLPDYAYAYANLGEALEQVGKKGEALTAYERAVFLDPEAPFVTEVRRRVAPTAEQLRFVGSA